MKYEKTLLALYVVSCALMSLNPAYRPAWWMENATVWLILAVVLWLYWRGIKLSRFSYTIIWLGFMAHTVGGYYTFQCVPLGDMISQLAGYERNCYDRIGHFLCGCFAYPLQDMATRKHWFSRLRVSLPYQLAAITAVGALYELIEWLTVLITEQATGLTYVGAQGDAWDAQADIFSCFLGGIASLALYCFVYKRKKTKTT